MDNFFSCFEMHSSFRDDHFCGSSASFLFCLGFFFQKGKTSYECSPVRTDGCATQEMRLKSTAALSETKHSLSGRSAHMPPHSSTERLTRLTRPFQSPLFTSSPQEKSIWQHPCPPLFPAVTHLLSLHQSAEKLCWGRLHAPPHTPSTHTHTHTLFALMAP